MNIFIAWCHIMHMEWPIISFSVCNAFPTMAVYFNLIFKNNFEWKCAISHNEIGIVICVNIYTIPHHPYVMQMIMFLFIFRFFFAFHSFWLERIKYIFPFNVIIRFDWLNVQRMYIMCIFEICLSDVVSKKKFFHFDIFVQSIIHLNHLIAFYHLKDRFRENWINKLWMKNSMKDWFHSCSFYSSQVATRKKNQIKAEDINSVHFHDCRQSTS